MTEFLLLLSLWPFHHKASKTDAYWEAYFEAQRQKISDADCAKQDGLWFYAGEDGLINFSPASCDAAKQAWKTMHIDPVRMSRS